MSSKTSLFNKAIIKSDIKRFWWVSALYMISLLIFVLPHYFNCDWSIMANGLEQYVSDEGAFAVIAAFFTGGVLFSYLHNSKSVSAMHAIPVKRSTLYFSHYLSGVIISAAPILITGAVIGAMIAANNGNWHFAVKYVYTCLVYTAAMLSLSVFCSIISGSTGAAYVFTAGVTVLPMYSLLMINSVFSLNLFGYEESDMLVYLPEKIYIMGIDNMWHKASLWYIVLAAALFAAALLLYKIRKLENCSEIVAFKPLKYVFMALVTICFGLFGYIMFYETLSVSSLLSVFPLGFAALAATHMLNNKSFSLKGLLKPTIVLAAATIILCAAFDFDITGFERRVPDAENVESIEIKDNNGNLISYNYPDTIPYEDLNNIRKRAIVEKDRANIENLINLHKAIVSVGEEYQNQGVGMTFNIKYNLKNGGSLKRNYYINPSQYEPYVINFIESDSFVNNNYNNILQENADDIVSVKYSGMDSYDDTVLNGINYQELLNALKADINNLNYKQLLYYNRSGDEVRRHIFITVNSDIYVKNKKYTGSYDLRIPIDNNFPRTSKIVEEELKKYSNKFISAEDISEVQLYYNSLKSISGKDAADIYNFCLNYTIDSDKYWNGECQKINLQFDGKQNKSTYATIWIPINNTPGFISEYLEYLHNGDEDAVHISDYEIAADAN